MIYRALMTLETGKRKIEKGAIVPAGWLTDRALAILETNGTIVQEPMPPVAAIPALKAKVSRLHKAGIEDVGTFLEAPDGELAAILKMPEAEVHALKAQIYIMFATPKREG